MKKIKKNPYHGKMKIEGRLEKLWDYLLKANFDGMFPTTMQLAKHINSFRVTADISQLRHLIAPYEKIICTSEWKGNKRISKYHWESV